MKFIAPENAALIIVDPQVDFCPGGALAVPDGNLIMPTINELRKSFNTIVITQDFHPDGHSSFASKHAGRSPLELIEMPYGPQVLWPDHCVQGTAGAEFHPDLIVEDTDLIIQKGTNTDVDSYSAFFENDQTTPPRFENEATLAETLKDKGIDTLVMAGLARDFCVGFSASDARVKHDFEVAVVLDATKAIAMPTKDGASNSDLDMQEKLGDEGVALIDADEVPQFLAP